MKTKQIIQKNADWVRNTVHYSAIGKFNSDIKVVYKWNKCKSNELSSHKTHL
jgi:hypothetical protein